jgi:hypothetical protein
MRNGAEPGIPVRRRPAAGRRRPAAPGHVLSWQRRQAAPRRRWLFAAALAIAGCGGPARLDLPAGGGRPEPEATARFEDATADCRDCRTLTAEVRLSGTVDGRRVGGTIVVGTDAAGGVRLEAPAPFGAPVFVLAARPGAARLVLPRERRYVDAPDAAALLDAVAGLRLSGADLHALLTGCGVAAATPSGGERFPSGWIAVPLAPDAVAWLRDGVRPPRLAAMARAGLQVEYVHFAGAWPSSVRVFASATRDARLALRLSQVEVNAPITPEAFEVALPPGAAPMSLAELGASGLLGR